MTLSKKTGNSINFQPEVGKAYTINEETVQETFENTRVKERKKE